MLVSSIARFNAVNTMNNAAFMSLNAANSMVNRINNTHAFGGEHDTAMLNKIDKKLSLDLLTNNLLYKVSYLQEKIAGKHQNNELKKSLNVLG